MEENNTLKQAQKVMLDILIEIDKICTKYKLQYWLESGTLLGAVRHQGFIPWDDDLDISMPLEDYKTFCKVARKELPQELFLQTQKSDISYPYHYAKIRSDRGKIIEKHEENRHVTYNQGIFVDIFPMICIKNTRFHRKVHVSMLLAIKLFSYKYLNIRFMEKIFIETVNKMNHHECQKNNLVVFSGNAPYPRFSIDNSKLFPLKRIKFCTLLVPVPSNTDMYLTKLYGKEYMVLPPKESRKTHAASIEVYSEK